MPVETGRSVCGHLISKTAMGPSLLTSFAKVTSQSAIWRVERLDVRRKYAVRDWRLKDQDPDRSRAIFRFAVFLGIGVRVTSFSTLPKQTRD
jgi:hypothetical protein